MDLESHPPHPLKSPASGFAGPRRPLPPRLARRPRLAQRHGAVRRAASGAVGAERGAAEGVLQHLGVCSVFFEVVLPKIRAPLTGGCFCFCFSCFLVLVSLQHFVGFLWLQNGALRFG